MRAVTVCRGSSGGVKVVGEKRSRQDWALERERQEALTLRDRRLRKNAWALVWIIAVMFDPFGGAGGIIEKIGDQVRPQPTPVERPQELRSQSTEPAACRTTSPRSPTRPWRSLRARSTPPRTSSSRTEHACRPGVPLRNVAGTDK